MFNQNIRSGLVTHEIIIYFSTALFDINVATSLITELYLKASDCMSYTISNKLVPSRNAWFDKENTQGHITNMINLVIFLSAVHLSLF